MIKILPLFLSCLLFFGSLAAQTDTPATAVPPVSSGMQQTGDPGQKGKDSIAPRPKKVKKAASVVQRKDSVQPTLIHASGIPLAPGAVAVAGRLADSPGMVIVRVPDTAALRALKQDAAARALFFKTWDRLLGTNPSFNFMGKPMIETEEIHRSNSKDLAFYLFLAILFYFALVRIFFEKYFGNLITLFFRVSIRQAQIREQVLQAPLPSLLLNGLFIMTGGLYACYLLRYYHFAEAMNFWILYLDCMLALGMIYLVKFLVLKFCGWVFNISRATDTYVFVVFLVNKMLGIFLLPLLILITFSGPTARDIYVTISIAMVFIFLIYRIGASFRPIRNEIKLTPFHFFLYLCAFEIAPLLLIYKVLLTYLEKAY